LCDDRKNAIIIEVAEVELHDEVVDWLATLTDAEWERVVVIVDRLADLGSQARMPLPAAWVTGCSSCGSPLGPTARRITYRFTKDGRIILLTTFRKQRNNERNEIDRARKAAAECALRYP
jgi:hypothetical protein